MAIQSSINQAIHSISQLSGLGKIGKESEKTAQQTEVSSNIALASVSDKTLEKLSRSLTVQEEQNKKIDYLRNVIRTQFEVSKKIREGLKKAQEVLTSKDSTIKTTPMGKAVPSGQGRR